MVHEESNGPDAHAETDPGSESESTSELDFGPEKWLERLATAEDIPPDEVFERLVSSYWLLEEIHDVLDQTDEGKTDLFHDETAPTEQSSDELAEIRDRLDRLEAHSEEKSGGDDGQADPHQELRGQLTMLTQRIDAVKEQLRDRQRSLDSRVDQELEYLIPILDYLIDTTDDLGENLDAVADQQETLRDRQDAHDQLVDLKRRASRLGVTTAACEYCETSVDLRLLPTPDCPECDHRFQDITPASGWFGWGTDTLAVKDDPPS